MNVFALGAVVVVAAAALFYSRKGEASEVNQNQSLDALFRKHGATYGIDPDLLKAIAMVESSLIANAVRWNPPHDVSVGAMQILCTPPADYDGSDDYVCANRFNIDPWPVRFSDLSNPDLNIKLAAQILRWNIRTFGYPRGVAVYNAWESRHAGVSGPFPNQSYVDKVLRNLNRIKQEAA